jgi:hypothetical protein
VNAAVTAAVAAGLRATGARHFKRFGSSLVLLVQLNDLSGSWKVEE